MAQNARAYVIAWGIALLFYVLEYATRSAPGVMMPQLEQAFGRTGVGVSNILGSYYYTYSITSLVGGLALDRSGAKYVVPMPRSFSLPDASCSWSEIRSWPMSRGCCRGRLGRSSNRVTTGRRSKSQSESPAFWLR